ncbi:MAG: dipeptide ABC transporter ATP-binding protein [Alphaproteobacteria bacterium]
MSLLAVQNLGVKYTTPTQVVMAVDDLSFSLKAGKTLCLIGESGSGKSTAALSIPQLLTSPPASLIGGSKIQLNGEDIASMSPRQLRQVRGKSVGVIFQEPMTSLNPLQRAGKQISEALRVHQPALGHQGRINRVHELLVQVGLEEPRIPNSFPHQLSGGQRQRVMIAMALANNPQLLIADEPTTALDLTTQKQVLDLLKRLQRDLNLAVLLVTHDFGVVRYMGGDAIVLKEGRQVERGTVEKVLTSPEDAYTKSLLAAEPGDPPTKINRRSELALRSENISVSYLGSGKEADLVAVQPMNFQLALGETLGVVGESGSGKSSLALALLQLIPHSGKTHLNKDILEQLTDEDLRARRANIQIVFQDPFSSLSPRLTAEQIIAEGLEVHRPKLTVEEISNAVDSTLSQVQMNPIDKHRYPHEFSGGQRQRIALARALILEPKVLILDEPTSALDRAVRAEFLQLLRSLQRKKGLAYIFISHDLAVVRSLAHHLLVMENGHVVESGDVRQVFSKPQHHYTKKLLSAFLT